MFFNRLWMCGFAALLVCAVSAAGQAPSAEVAKEAQRRYKTGLTLMKAERWGEAADEFKAAISADPLMTLAHYNLGQCRMAQKRFVEAVGAYETCRDAFERLGTLSQKDRQERDRARRDEINELRNDLARLHTLKDANALRYETQMDDRIRVLEAMQGRDLGADEKVPGEVYLALGSAYFRQEKLADAEREYRAALRINTKLGAAHNNLAVILLMTGRVEEAEAETALAERHGHRVSAAFKEDLKAAKRKR